MTAGFWDFADERAVAADLAELMVRLGEPAYVAVGHDRGCYVAMRLALDHPHAARGVVLLDGIPVTEALDRVDARFARDWYHWFFFAVPDKPERAINADPLEWYRHDPVRMGEANHAEWVQAVTNPDTVRAMLEDRRGEPDRARRGPAAVPRQNYRLRAANGAAAP